MAPRMGGRACCRPLAPLLAPALTVETARSVSAGGPAPRRVRDGTKDIGGTCLIALGDEGHDTRLTELP
jgi:hypothetical protein